jgi:arylsulfatase A-like enzyme
MSGRRPNLFVFVLDTLRLDQLRGVGAPAEPQNFLERTLRSGTLFSNFFPAGGTTRISVNGMFNGFLGGTSRLNHQQCHLRFDQSEALTLTEVFRHHGYSTLGLTQGHISLQPAGFDELWTRQPRFSGERIKQLIASRPGPVFTYLHLYEVHDPVFAEPQSMTADNYRRHLDRMAEEIEDVWAAIGPDDVVVIASDHGCRLRPRLDPDWRFYDEEEPSAGMFLTEATIRGVCAIVAPRCFPDVEVRELVSGIDLFPTLFDGLGLEGPAVQGLSLWPALKDGAAWPRDHVYLETGAIPLADGTAPSRCVRDGRWKYVYHATHGEALFDLENDPGEETNLLGSGCAAEAVMRERMRQQLADNRGGVHAYYRDSASLCRRLLAERRAPDAVHTGERSISFAGWIDARVCAHLREQLAAHLPTWRAAGERIVLYSASDHARAFIEAGGDALKKVLLGVVDANPTLVGGTFCGVPVLSTDTLGDDPPPSRILVAHHHYAGDIYVALKNRLAHPVPVYNIYHLDRRVPLWWDRAAAG